jgi:hypothetical protein
MAPQTAIQEAIGTAQQEFADKAKGKREELIEGGQCEPFSIANFNPTELGLQGELMRYKVPTPDDTRLPKGVLRITLPYDGKDRVGHVVTIREPHIYGRNVNATWHPGGGPGDAVPQREVMYYTPMAIAFNFLEHYSPIFITAADGRTAAPPKDGRKIYGVLVWKGDIHTLQRALEEDRVERRKIDVPVAVVRGSGKTAVRTYRAVSTSLDDYLDHMFAGQLRFADAIITRGQQKWQGTDDDRKDISASDRVWYRWAIKLGYTAAPKPGERTWLNDLLSINAGLPNHEEVAASKLRKCPACRTREPEQDTPFCPKCNAPMDVFQTFMGVPERGILGVPVPEAWLQTLRGEQREIVLEELRIRSEGFGQTNGRGPYKGKSASQPVSRPASQQNTAEIPDAPTTELPGEEGVEDAAGGTVSLADAITEAPGAVPGPAKKKGK